MSKKQAVVKRSNGNINITIENNLKANQTAVAPTKKYKRRRNQGSSNAGQEMLRGGAGPGGGKMLGGGGGLLPPIRPTIDVSYIRTPPQSYSIWNDSTIPDPNNFSIGYSQAQQVGLISKPPQPITVTATNTKNDHFRIYQKEYQ